MNRRPPAPPFAGAGDRALSEPLPGEDERRRVLARLEAAFAEDQSGAGDAGRAVYRATPPPQGGARIHPRLEPARATAGDPALRRQPVHRTAAPGLRRGPPSPHPTRARALPGMRQAVLPRLPPRALPEMPPPRRHAAIRAGIKRQRTALRQKHPRVGDHDTDGCHGVRHVAFRPDWGILWVEIRREGEVL